MSSRVEVNDSTVGGTGVCFDLRDLPLRGRETYWKVSVIQARRGSSRGKRSGDES